ncbi:MAG: archaellin/type IV pilin N-terminal domain-containing protein [archaeon]|jgi:flagellin-like protein
MYNKFKLNKKGVSPLIATILLVAVSLSLAGILYSWASQNAGDTVNNVTETSKKWRDCSAINIYMEYGCTYDITNGISFILMDSSTVDIDDNLTLTIIDANQNVRSTSFAPSFSGRAMAINKSSYPLDANFTNLVKPLQRVRIYVEGCPDRAATTNTCD